MFFFKKKKLIEIDKKIDSVMVQLVNSNQRYEQILDFFSKIDKKLNLIEEISMSNLDNVSKSVKESEHSIIEMTAELRDDLKMFGANMERISEKMVAELNETINSSSESLQHQIADDGVENRKKTDSVSLDLNNKVEMVDSLLKLLLLNSVMDQIEER